MYTFLIVIYLIVCITLVTVILMQSGKGGGLSEALGGAFQSVFGPKVTTVLVKSNVYLSSVIYIIEHNLSKTLYREE